MVLARSIESDALTAARDKRGSGHCRWVLGCAKTVRRLGRYHCCLSCYEAIREGARVLVEPLRPRRLTFNATPLHGSTKCILSLSPSTAFTKLVWQKSFHSVAFVKKLHKSLPEILKVNRPICCSHTMSIWHKCLQVQRAGSLLELLVPRL